jgi:hypothetical protein
MIAFFQVLFFLCSIILIVLNIFDLRNYLEKKKDPKGIPFRLNWLYFILTTVVALGCFLNILVTWVKK